MTASRHQLRQQLRTLRRAIPEAQRQQFAIDLATSVGLNEVFRRSQRIAAYLAADGEIDPHPLLEMAWRQNKQVFLPVLLPYRGNRLWFAPYHPDSKLKPNRFGILEPRVGRRELTDPQTLDLVLTPLVGFDRQGNRLGMGGGYYDRSFAFLHHRRHWQRPRLLGLAFECQHVEQLPHHPWDVPLYGIATEQGVHIPNR
jgi:5-formyltetrahydrofolate cyclo-ligase